MNLNSVISCERQIIILYPVIQQRLNWTYGNEIYWEGVITNLSSESDKCLWFLSDSPPPPSLLDPIQIDPYFNTKLQKDNELNDEDPIKHMELYVKGDERAQPHSPCHSLQGRQWAAAQARC